MTTQHGIHIMCDLDGVLADFNKGVVRITGRTPEDQPRKDMWKALTREIKDNKFFETLDMCEDAADLWRYIKVYNPIILTATGSTQKHEAEMQKRFWVSSKLGSNVRTIVVEDGADKAKYATPNTILIDDRPKAIDPWIAAGGIGILHYKSAATIKELRAILHKD